MTYIVYFTNFQAGRRQLAIPPYCQASWHRGVVASSSEVNTRVALRRCTETFFFQIICSAWIRAVAVNSIQDRKFSSWSCETVRREETLFCLTNRWWTKSTLSYSHLSSVHTSRLLYCSNQNLHWDQLFSCWKVVGFGTVVHFVVTWQIIFNYELIRL